MTYVVDASVAVEYLLRTPLGLRAATLLDGAMLMAPELLDVEVVSVLRRAVRGGHLNAQRATTAITDLMAWPVDRIRHGQLTMEAWTHRENVSAHDAFYVATARIHSAAIVTADTRLGRAPGLGVIVHNIRAST